MLWIGHNGYWFRVTKLCSSGFIKCASIEATYLSQLSLHIVSKALFFLMSEAGQNKGLSLIFCCFLIFGWSKHSQWKQLWPSSKWGYLHKFYWVNEAFSSYYPIEMKWISVANCLFSIIVVLKTFYTCFCLLYGFNKKQEMRFYNIASNKLAHIVLFVPTFLK